MVYGDFNGLEVDEKTNCKPIGIYGSLKYAGEIIVKSYKQVFDLPYTIIRPSALYGERCVSRRVGQIFIENAIQGKNIESNGDGNEKLDFTYIEDLVNGIVLCCENKNALNETNILLKALEKRKEKKVVIYPNSDTGYKSIIKAIYKKKTQDFIVIKN